MAIGVVKPHQKFGFTDIHALVARDLKTTAIRAEYRFFAIQEIKVFRAHQNIANVELAARLRLEQRRSDIHFDIGRAL